MNISLDGWENVCKRLPDIPPPSAPEMQNAKRKMQNEEKEISDGCGLQKLLRPLHFPF